VAALAIVVTLVAFNGGGNDDPGGDTANPDQTTLIPGNPGGNGSEDPGGDADEARFAWQASLSEETTGDVTALDAERVYITDDRGQVSAYDLANGGQTWTVNLGDSSSGTNPVRVGDVLLVSISEPSATYALEPATGQELWKATDVWVDDPLVVGDLVLGHIGNTITALDLGTGEIRWQVDSELWAWGNMAVAGDLVVTGSDDGKVQAINPADGSSVWVKALPRGDVYTEAIAVAGDVVIVVDDDQWVTGLDVATGTERWSKDMTANYYEAPLPIGDVVVVSTDTGLNFVDPATGQVLHSANGSGSVSTPAPGGAPAVLVTALTSLSAVDLEGRVLWTTDLPIDALEVEATDGYAVVTDFDGNMAVFTLTM
jgi:outer membrane protein assembly factor BamB